LARDHPLTWRSLAMASVIVWKCWANIIVTGRRTAVKPLWRPALCSQSRSSRLFRVVPT
jgi:hypothetical protein